MRWLWLLSPLGACSGVGAARTEALTASFDVVLADYEQTAAAAGTLTTAIEALCASPSEQGLTDARDAWAPMRAHWRRAAVAKFGPREERPERYGPLLDFGPADPVLIEERLAGESGVDAAALVDALAGVRGLPVVEYLLYLDDAVLTDARRCAYAAGAAGDVEATAAALSDAWEAWRLRLTNPDGTESPYVLRQVAVDEWVNRTGFVAEDIRRDVFVEDPVGFPSRFANHTVQDAWLALAGAHDVLAPILALVEDDATLVDREQAAYDAAATAILEIPEPIAATLASDPVVIDHAEEALRAYQSFISAEVAQALSVTVTFNDNDGD